MDGVHDLGGKQGFGSIDVEEGVVSFHEEWEARARCAINAMGRRDEWNIDWFRHVRELIDPVDYLSRPYYDSWVQAYSAMLVDSGIATVEELVSGKSNFTPEDASVPMTPEEVDPVEIGKRDFTLPVDDAPVFSVGDRVRTNADGVSGHTRLPAYARGRIGIIENHHQGHIFPDKAAHGEHVGEHLYTVSFALGDLFSESEGSKDRVALNLWESYLAAV